MRTAILLLAALLVTTATALSVVTTLLHRTTEDAVEAVESVRVAHTLEMELMIHRRALSLALLGGQPPGVHPDGPSRARLERLLVEARRYAPSLAEKALVDRAEAAIAAYLDAAREAQPASREALVRLEPRFDAAFVALDALAWFNVDEARVLTARAERWDRLADATSVVVGALALAGVVTLLAGLRSQMIRALSDLHDTVGRFMSGDAAARAPERGAREVRDLARSFNEMAATLARQEHDRLSFLSGLAQDLRDPLTVIKLLAQRIQPAEPVDMARGPVIARQIQRIERILRDVVDGALIASGRLDLKLSPSDLREPVLRAVDAYRVEAPDHVFDVAVPESPVIVCSDAARIEHTLNNLLSNAVKYSPSGSRVSVSLRDVDGRAIVDVSDQGVGMTREQCARAFEPFRRTGASQGTITGAGLGLAATKRLVEAHGGTIEVETAPHVGSTFRVTLPLVPLVPRTCPETRTRPAGV